MTSYTVTYGGEIVVDAASKTEAREIADMRLCQSLGNFWIDEIEVSP